MAQGNGDSNHLGLDSDITRRDFIGTALLGAGAALLHAPSPAAAQPSAGHAWTGYGGVGEYRTANGNTWEVMTAGHRMRDGAFEPLPANSIDTDEVYDCVVIGGGISGLAAALFFRQQAGPAAKCLVLDNHPIFGGEAKQNVFEVDGKRLPTHQGSAVFYTQRYPRDFLPTFFDSIGLRDTQLQYQSWAGGDPELPLGRTPFESVGLKSGHYGFWFADRTATSSRGMWVTDALRKQFEGAPVAADVKRDLLRWFSGEAAQHSTFVRPAFEGDEISRRLDTITLEQHAVERFGLSREFVRTYLSPLLGSMTGLGSDAISAYSSYAFYKASDGSGKLVYDPESYVTQMFAGGNTMIARLIVKTLLPLSIAGPHTVDAVSRNSVNFAMLDAAGSSTRIRLSSTVVGVQHDGDASKAETVSIAYLKDGKVYRVKARAVVMAGGCWTSKHIVKDLPSLHQEAYAQFCRSPCMVANVALRNWRFLSNLGISGGRWFEGLGDSVEVHKLALPGIDAATIGPDSPVVLSLKVLYPTPGLPAVEQGRIGRAQLYATSFIDYERRIREQFTAMFANSGFNAKRDIAGIILNRWGHAYISPQPGFFFGKDGNPSPREVLRNAPFGRISFANSDLAGMMDHRNAIQEAYRAVHQILDRIS